MDADLDIGDQGWDFFDQDYFDTFNMTELSYLQDSPVNFHPSSDNFWPMEASPSLLDFGFSGMELPNSFVSYGTETKGVNDEIDLIPSSESKASFTAETFSSEVPKIVKPMGERQEVRQIEEFLGEFESAKPKLVGRNHRRAYRPEKRKKVEQVRKAGACLRCRLLKRPVSLSVPTVSYP